MFAYMEDCGILDVTSSVDLCALHFVFLPRIQQHLDNFAAGYSHHPLRTEHGKSPLQLWMEGYMLHHYISEVIKPFMCRTVSFAMY